MLDDLETQGVEANPASPLPRRVAVIGVHGVAHHDPGETANDMADLLLSLPSFNPKDPNAHCSQREPRTFEHFAQKGLQITVEPVCLGPERQEGEKESYRVDPKLSQGPSPIFRLQEGSYKLGEYLARNRQIGDQPGQVGRTLSIQLLQNYYGAADSNKYVTTRLEGKRADSTEVHIYEMFWADLAKPTNSVLSFLLALFQFILHVPSLSRMAIDSRPNPDRRWTRFRKVHRYASWLLQMALPITKVLLLVAVSAAIPAVTQVKQLNLVSALVTGTIVTLLCLIAMNQARRPVFRNRPTWILASFLPGLIAGVAAFCVVRLYESPPSPTQPSNSGDVILLSAAIWMLGLVLVWWALKAYQSTRPGIFGWGLAAYGAALAGFIIACVHARGPEHRYAASWLQLGSFWTVQWILTVLRLSWICFALLAILSCLLGAIAWRNAKSRAEQSKARAAARTSRFALAMPAFLFVLVTSLIWAGLFSIERKIHEPFYDEDVVHPTTPVISQSSSAKQAPEYLDIFPAWDSTTRRFGQSCEDPKLTCSGPNHNTCSCSQETKPDYLKAALAWSVGSGSYIVVLITLTGLVILVWWALPSVLTERFPPRRRYDTYVKHRETEPPRNSTNQETMWMGAWTSRGLDSIAIVTWLSWFAIFVVPLAFMYIGPLGRVQWLDQLRAHSNYITAIVVCRVIAVATTTAILASLVHNSSPVLRVILDVDTYLRTGPIEATPRAKIFERYVSLLRHIAQYKGADGRGYDHVVIVAHSLGALISGDLLNLLNHQKNDPQIQELGFGPTEPENKVPMTLFTMGNPIRQLLNRFFPYLYDWIRDNPDNGSNPLPEPLEKPPAEIGAPLPNPADLGVEKWVSAYRSGDYVGRSLWLDEWYRRTDKCDNDGIYPEAIEKISDTDGKRVEFCIGAGAHTHYWDDTAPDIANELNELI